MSFLFLPAIKSRVFPALLGIGCLAHSAACLAFNLKSAYSTDGINWTTTGQTIASAANSPGAVFDGKQIKLYYMTDLGQPISAGQSGLFVASSADGQGWTFNSIPVFKNMPRGYRACDPEVVVLENRRYRMYFYESAGDCNDPALPDTTVFSIASAISSDGVNFTREEGYRYRYPKVMDPSVVRVGVNKLGQDVWQIFASYNFVGKGLDGLRTVSAVSIDGGLTFQNSRTVELRNSNGLNSMAPSVVAVPGGYRMYYWNPVDLNIYSGFSADGEKWNADPGVRVPCGGNMAAVKAGNLYWMFYATMQTPQVHSDMPLVTFSFENFMYAFAVWNQSGQIYYSSINAGAPSAWGTWTLVPGQMHWTNSALIVSSTNPEKNSIQLKAYVTPLDAYYSVTATCRNGLCQFGAWEKVLR